MRVLLLHCDRMEYRPAGREIAAAEDLADEGPRRLEEVAVAMVSVEEGDGDGTARRAASEVAAAMAKVGCGRLLIYPYAHLSGRLAAPGAALGVLERMEEAAASEAGGSLEVSRAPFGWTKSYTMSVKAHPLAEHSMEVRGGGEGGPPAAPDKGSPAALASEKGIESSWHVMTPDGRLVAAAGFDYSGHPGLEALARYEESRRRSSDEPPPHVALMKRLAIADYEPASDPGNMRFYPNGRLVKSLIERYVTMRVRQYGGYEVETPIMYDSRHPGMASYFDRFPARQYNVDSEGRRLFLRFAACFGQFLMAHDMQMSHRNLPYRLYELTRYSFRREQSGELAGLRRLRAFTMPDCHAFCRDMPQAVREMMKRFDLSKEVVADLGIPGGGYEMAVRLTEEFYRENGQAVRDMARKHGRPVLVEMWKERFFYFVLKWEFNYIDAAGKASALSTDQIDVENGGRYGIEFVDENNERRNPVILHNSPSGAVERVMYALLENAAADAARGAKPELPLWLAPTQVRIIPVREEFAQHAAALAGRIGHTRVRVDLDDRSESIGKRIRDAEREWVRYILVVGGREAETDVSRLSVRDRRSGETRTVDLDDFLAEVRAQTEGKPFAVLNSPFYLSRRPQAAA